jgi:sarcosine oxidase subunit alpha
LKTVDIAVIGGGPAGLSAAINAASLGAGVALIDRNDALGGQLVKQTHMFFGSQKQYASVRGIDIARILQDKLSKCGGNVEVMLNTTVLGVYEDGVITIEQNERRYFKMRPRSIIVATGASEKVLPFPNNDLPGIYGAGAVQTLMNVYGVVPGNRVLMVGAGNIGLIVSYQLMQAGVSVKAIIDAAPRIGGYLVHASKVARMGVPILTSHTVKEAIGKESLERAVVVRLDDNWQPIEGSEREFEVDVMCISVGLSPLTELLWQAGCQMKYVAELGGYVPVRDHEYRTSVESIYVAGDVSGVEEASAAMVEGQLAGLCAAKNLGFVPADVEDRIKDCTDQLKILRSGPVGAKIRNGLEKLLGQGVVKC